TMAKSLAGGFPLSGVVGRAEVMDAPAPGGLGGTYAGNPLAVAIGDGVTATVPLLWVVMICATFARPNGLFIAHFGWPRS
ncbi:aminotransferase class III-fold pyridoxal phosphate-dependent enzyme, partial [Klebsiella pneumoniae]|uniref:aminotransferase class III-fold pyridoxal phosphate-dependent enzyme n=1 Tax=Klebsiella pneumoniae TaxID=573 RepID=UPI0025A2AE7C